MEELRAQAQHQPAIRPFGISEIDPSKILNRF
jgi:hypothetical protein